MAIEQDLRAILSLTRETRRLFEEESFERLFAEIAQRDEKLRALAQEIEKLDDDERACLFDRKPLRDLIQQIKTMDVDNMEVINLALTSISDSIVEIGQKRKVIKDWRNVSSARAKQLIDFTY